MRRRLQSVEAVALALTLALASVSVCPCELSSHRCAPMQLQGSNHDLCCGAETGLRAAHQTCCSSVAVGRTTLSTTPAQQLQAPAAADVPMLVVAATTCGRKVAVAGPPAPPPRAFSSFTVLRI